MTAHDDRARDELRAPAGNEEQRETAARHLAMRHRGATGVAPGSPAAAIVWALDKLDERDRELERLRAQDTAAAAVEHWWDRRRQHHDDCPAACDPAHVQVTSEGRNLLDELVRVRREGE